MKVGFGGILDRHGIVFELSRLYLRDLRIRHWGQSGVWQYGLSALRNGMRNYGQQNLLCCKSLRRSQAIIVTADSG